MGIYANQIKARYKAIREDRLMAMIKSVCKTQAEIDAALASLRSPRAGKPINTSPLSSKELTTLKAVKKATSWRAVAEILDCPKPGVKNTLARLALRYFINL